MIVIVLVLHAWIEMFVEKVHWKGSSKGFIEKEYKLGKESVYAHTNSAHELR